MRPATEAVKTLDLHSKNRYQAKIAIDAALRNAKGVYRIRAVHGYHSGTAIRDMILSEYASHPAVKRLVRISDGITDLVLKELSDSAQ